MAIRPDITLQHTNATAPCAQTPESPTQALLQSVYFSVVLTETQREVTFLFATLQGCAIAALSNQRLSVTTFQCLCVNEE